MNHIAYLLIEQNDEHASEKDTSSDLHRLEHKVNLILQMLSQMMTSNPEIPAQKLIRLSADEIAWHDSNVLVGEKYSINLYISEHSHVPIQALVRITKVESGWCHGLFDKQSVDEQSSWERWVFRQHRRKIAMAKSFNA